MTTASKKNIKKIRLIVRSAKLSDTDAIIALSEKVYGEGEGLTTEMLHGQMAHFPEGQFIAEYNNEVIGHCATFAISEEACLSAHSWHEITGHGFASRHNANGDYLYGMEVCVDNDYRGLRVGQRLYDARKTLCQELELKGIVFGGRMPGYAKESQNYLNPSDYLKAVESGKIKDFVVNFQLKNNFEIIGVLENYLPIDKESGGHASHMLWRNPNVDTKAIKKGSIHVDVKNDVRIASVQYHVRDISDFDDFKKQIEYFVDVAANYRSDFVVFPEMITIPLLSIEKTKLTPQESVAKIATYTNEFIDFMQKLSISYNINIIGGSHPTTLSNGNTENHAYIFLRDGAVHTQPKLHPTPNERYWWSFTGGNTLKTIQTDCGPIGVLICYDSEFPEPVRYLADQGAKILFVPYCTDERQGHLRVKYCCQARAIENQMYVVTSGIVGNLPNVDNMDVHYAQSGIYTPCDFPFARDGIAAMADANTEAIIFADVRLDQLTVARNSGTVQNLKDRRFDLYHVEWKRKKKADKS